MGSKRVILEPDRQCLVCNDWPYEKPWVLPDGRKALTCRGCGIWLPRHGALTDQGAVSTWHRRMDPKFLNEAKALGVEAYGYPQGFN